ncbi:MAG: adenosylcobinamide-GDP ribazoletransferase [Roseibium album]|uniref:adenosylcobinamide-GDP ribazoletransferase n=1 Tax=Roseibium album TaxID=311410 RepID=UPI001A33A5B6|nr:adenosylcobinamide-GDP ribazoletransferase [Labrenzia sp. EL_132]MBG6200681.1 adenosylcobinamide-GDP ribazoletransferase [Labrenzia sp. EL_13]MBG6231572.1 adenosylcobinamide-GDP ribazoletransferase [Labrenzia sp. EL_208]
MFFPVCLKVNEPILGAVRRLIYNDALKKLKHRTGLMNPETDQTSNSRENRGSNDTKNRSNGLTGAFSRLAADTAACVRFFSRLPLPQVNSADDPSSPPDFSRIARAAPLAGVAVALPAAGLGMFLAYTHLPGLVVATIAIALLCATTGALHEDGMSDVADGFFGGTTRERRLDIMKDSRIGAFGALALVLTVVLRIFLLASLWQKFSPADAALLFLASEAISRTMLVWQWYERPLARLDGLAARYGKPGGESALQAVFLTIPLLIPAALILTVPALLVGVLVAAAAAFGTGRLSVQKIGGVTGDVLGAIQQICGLGFLTGMLMVH